MGGLLVKPKTAKHTQNGTGASGSWAFGVSEMQGWREAMEDAHLAMPDFDTSRKLGLFGVFDGHGGGAVAKVAARRFPEVFRSTAAFQKERYSEALYDAFLLLDKYINSAEGRKEVAACVDKEAPGLNGGGAEEEDDEDMIRRLVESGEVTEEQVQEALAEAAEEEEEEEEESADMEEDEEEEDGSAANSAWRDGEGPDGMGTTAVVALVRGGEEVICANAGDSRCVLARGEKAIALSRDHKPQLKMERTRIKKAGGFVTSEGRVDGNLNLSRALGDFAYKKDAKLKAVEQKISPEAELRSKQLTPSDRYLVLGCDGIFEKVTNQGLLDFLLPRLRQRRGRTQRGRLAKTSLSSVCSSFLDHNVAGNPAEEGGLGCDNMTLMIVDLRAEAAGPAGAEVSNNAVPAAGAGRAVVHAARGARVRRGIGKGTRRLLVARAHRRRAVAQAAAARAR